MKRYLTATFLRTIFHDRKRNAINFNVQRRVCIHDVTLLYIVGKYGLYIKYKWCRSAHNTSSKYNIWNIIKEQNVESFNVSRLLVYEIHQLSSIKSNSNTEKCLVMQSISPMMPRVKCKNIQSSVCHDIISANVEIINVGDVFRRNKREYNLYQLGRKHFLVHVYACVRNILTTVCTRRIHHLRSSNIVRNRGCARL